VFVLAGRWVWYDRKAAADAAQKAFVNRVGDFGLLGNSGSLLGDGSFEFEVMGDRLQDLFNPFPQQFSRLFAI